jgi:c-di-GMP-binding flagellar brake protein YcgR
MFSRLVRIIKGRDKRRERRVAVRMPAAMSEFRGRITDISLGGCGFYADEGGALVVGDHVTAHLMPNGEDPFEVPARIVGQDDEGMVYCVAFTEVSAENFDRLQDVIVHQALGTA